MDRNAINKVKGEHLKEIRQYLGKTQKEFGYLLGEWGVTDSNGNSGKEEKIIASWESGRRGVPNKVLKLIMNNVEYNGQKIRWEYLCGEDNYKTYNDIIAGSRAILDHFNNPSQNTSNADIKDTDIPLIYDSNLKCFRRMSIKEEAKHTCIINALTMCGYNWNEINDTDNFIEFMGSSLDSMSNSIELYMKTINPTKRKDDEQ